MPEYKRTIFKASAGWFYNFIKRAKLSKRKGTHILQRFPLKLEEKVQDFIKEVWDHRREAMKKKYDLWIGNMDEVPVFLDLQSGHTYHMKGEREIKILRTKNPKMRVTVVLCALSNGEKLPPFIIFKGKADKPSKVRNGVHEAWVASNANAWMTNDLLREWFKLVWLNAKANRGSRKYLLYDSFAAHLNTDNVKYLTDRNNLVTIIPGGCTPILQPLDVMINKPFKDKLRPLFKKWFNQEAELGNLPKIKTPSKDLFVSWVMEAWNEVDANIVRQSFKSASITNSLDGSESYLCNKFINDSTSIKDYVEELIKNYVDNDDVDEPYEDLDQLKEEVRNNEAITYDLPQDVIFKL